MSLQDEIEKLISEQFQQKLIDTIFLEGIGKISTASNQPSQPLTMEVLESAINSLYPPPKYVFFISMISALEIWRSLKKQGLRIKRVKKQNTLKIYSGLLFIADIHVDPWNHIPAGKMIQYEKSQFELRLDFQLRDSGHKFFRSTNPFV